MHILMIINAEKYPYHHKLARMFEESLASRGEVQTLDMAEQEALHEAFYKIQSSGCNPLITFDCAGFEMRTENDLPAYNILGCRIAHILYRSMQEYRYELAQQMNFSAFLYSVREEDVLVMRERCPNIPNPEWMEKIGCGDQGPEAEKKNRETILRWFDRFCRDAELG